MDTVEKNRIEEKLAQLDETLSTLQKIVPQNYKEYEKAGKALKWDVERGLQLVSEIEVDIAVILYKRLKKGIAGEEASILSALSNELGEETVIKLKERRKLRNELVHAYTINNDSDAFKQASNLNDVNEYEANVKGLLAKLAKEK